MKKVWFVIVALVIAFVNVVKLSFVFSHGLFLIFFWKIVCLIHHSRDIPEQHFVSPKKVFREKNIPLFHKQEGKWKIIRFCGERMTVILTKAQKMMHHDFRKTLLVDKRGFFCMDGKTISPSVHSEKALKPKIGFMLSRVGGERIYAMCFLSLPNLGTPAVCLFAPPLFSFPFFSLWWFMGRDNGSVVLSAGSIYGRGGSSD